MNITPLYSERETIEQGKQKIVLKLRVELDKESYIQDIVSFYSERASILDDILSSSPMWWGYSERIRKDESIGLSDIELTFFKDLKYALIQKILFDKFDHTFSVKQEDGKLTTDFRNQKFNGLINIELSMPQIREVKGLFHTRKEKIALPNLTFSYFLSGEGEENAIEEIIRNYSGIIDFYLLKEIFSRGERVIITDSVKERDSKEINFKIDTRLEILPEHYIKENNLEEILPKLSVSKLEENLFEERRGGLLYKLFHDSKLRHKIISENNNEIKIAIKNQDSSLQAELYSTIKKTESSFMTLVYNIKGKADVKAEEEIGYLLKEYWPSTEE